MRGSGRAWKSTRTQREAMVTRSTGTSSARITNTVDGGGSSTVFSRRAAPSGRSRWNSSRMSTFRCPSTGESEATRMISSTCSLAMAGPTRWTSRTSGCSPASGQPGVAAGGVARRIQEQGGEGPRGLELGAARRVRRRGRRGRDRRPRRCSSATAVGCPTTRSQMVALIDLRSGPLGPSRSAHRPVRSRTAARTASATSSIGPRPSSTTQRFGSAAASRRKPSATRA